MMPYGILPRDPGIVRDDGWFGVPLRKELPTRWEEYTFVRDALREVKSARDRPMLLDAATGFEPGVHVMPEIAANDGWEVWAIDKEPQVEFPQHPFVHRVEMDVSNLTFDDRVFDAVVCVSALEHMVEDVRFAAIDELHRVARPGATVVVTMDNVRPAFYVEKYADKFDFGDEVPIAGGRLQPSVTYFKGVVRT